MPLVWLCYSEVIFTPGLLTPRLHQPAALFAVRQGLLSSSLYLCAFKKVCLECIYNFTGLEYH